MSKEKAKSKKNIDFTNVSWTWIIGTAFVVLCLIFLLIDVLPISFGATSLGRFARGLGLSDYLEILGIHYTTVFLTTSLMSTLGESADYVYYEDIIDRTLLEPNGLDFHSLSVYAFLTIGISTVAAVVRSPYVFLTSFAAGIITITFLFFKMVRIYFKRSSWEKRIFKEMTSEKNDLSQYLEKIQKLRYVISSNIENKEKDKIVVNLAFIIELLRYFSSTNQKNKSISEDKKREYEKKYKSANTLYIEAISKVCESEDRNTVLDYLLQVIALLKKQNKNDAIIEAADRIIRCLMENSNNEISAEQFEMIRICHRDSLETVVKQKEDILFGIIENIENEKWTKSYYLETETWSSDPMNHLLSEVDEKEDTSFSAVSVSCDAYCYGCEAVKLLMVRTYPEYETVYRINEEDHVSRSHIYHVIEKFLEKDEKVVASGYTISNEKRGFETEFSGLFAERLPGILAELMPEGVGMLIENIYSAYASRVLDYGEYESNGNVGFGPIKYNNSIEKSVFETVCIALFRGFAEIINIYSMTEYIDILTGMIGNFFGIVSQYTEDAEECEKLYENMIELIGLKFTDVFVVREDIHGYIESELEREELDIFKESMTKECLENPFENGQMGFIDGTHLYFSLVPLKGFNRDTVFRKFDNLFE